MTMTMTTITADADGRVALSLDEVATMLGVSMATLYRWMREGRLRTMKIVGTRRVLVTDLAAFLDAHRL